MVHFVRAPDRAAAERLASRLVDRHRPLCLSSRDVAGDLGLPTWKVETIDVCGEALSSAKPVTLIAWREPRR